MNDIKIATAQFEHRSGDKKYNLQVINNLSREAAKREPMSLPFMNAQ